tara:strand:+ start:115 stop:396 length:282 start_codon:yes stop_codon:yes gene_type:complete
MIAPRTKSSAQENLKSSMLLNTDTAQMMKEILTNTLLNKDKDVKQFKDTLGLKKNVDDNIIFNRSKRNKQVYAQNTKLLMSAIEKQRSSEVGC